MKSPVTAAALVVLAGCSSTETVSDEPLTRCESTDCFNQLQIRDYDVVDGNTVVVYVGPQECAFRVDFSGAFCDLSFYVGDIVFRRSNQRERAFRDPEQLPDFRNRPNVFNSRVCANDFGLGLREGPFTQAGGPNNDPTGLDCRVADVVSLTDDELIELYVDKRLAPPPPPLGQGQIEVGEPDETSEAEAEEGGAPSSEAADSEAP